MAHFKTSLPFLEDTQKKAKKSKKKGRFFYSLGGPWVIHYVPNYATPIQNVQYYQPVVLVSCLIASLFQFYYILRHPNQFESNGYFYVGLIEICLPIVMIISTLLGMRALSKAKLR